MFRCNTLRAAVALALLVPGAAFAQDMAALIARNAEYIDAHLSPDGQYVAVNTPDGEGRAVSMIKLGGAGERNLFRFSGHEDRWGNYVRKEPIDLHWSNDSRLVVVEGYDYGRFGNKFSSGNVYATDANAGQQVQLFGYVNDSSNFRSRLKDEGSPHLMEVLDDGKGTALFYFLPWTMQASKRTTSVFEVDTHSGSRKQVESFDDYVTVYADNTGKARVNTRRELDGTQVVQYRATADSEWKTMPEAMSGQSFAILDFDTDNKTAYAEISDKGEAAQIYRIDMATGTRERLGGQPNQEVGYIERAGRKGPPVVLRYSAGKPKIDYLDPKSPWVQLHAGLMKAFPGQLVDFIDVTRDEQKVLFFTHSDRDPGAYYIFDRTTNKPSLLFRTREWIDPARMAQTMPLEFNNRNGDSLFGFLTIPQGKSGNMALVVMPHGGPFGIYDEWGFNDDAQYLASLGYAVLQVNYRGSGLRGDNFEVAGYRKWGTAIQDDIADGVKHVISQGLVNKDKVCIYGGSFGGYSAMMNPIRNPGMYKCAIGYAGVYDLKKLYADRDGSKQLRAFFDRTMGDAMTQADQSPLAQVAKLDVPMLLIHGKSDETAPFSQFTWAEATLRQAGKTVETLAMPDEGHGFYKTANQVQAYQRMRDFLLKYNPPN